MLSRQGLGLAANFIRTPLRRRFPPNLPVPAHAATLHPQLRQLLFQSRLRYYSQSSKQEGNTEKEKGPEDECAPSPIPIHPPQPIKLPSATASPTTSPTSSGKDAKPDASSVLKLLTLAKPEWKLLTAGVAFLSVSTAVNLSIPWAIGRIIDFFAPGSDETLLFGLPLEHATGALAAILLIGAAANSGRSVCLRLAGQRTVARIRYVRSHLQDMTFINLLQEQNL